MVKEVKRVLQYIYYNYKHITKNKKKLDEKENNDSVTIAKPHTHPHTSVVRRKLESYLLKNNVSVSLSLSFHFREQFPPPQEIKTKTKLQNITLIPTQIKQKMLSS